MPNTTDKLAEALRIGEDVESLFLNLTGDGRIDCRDDAVLELCDAFTRFHDARILALYANDIAKAQSKTTVAIETVRRIVEEQRDQGGLGGDNADVVNETCDAIIAALTEKSHV